MSGDNEADRELDMIQGGDFDAVNHELGPNVPPVGFAIKDPDDALVRAALDGDFAILARGDRISGDWELSLSGTCGTLIELEESAHPETVGSTVLIGDNKVGECWVDWKWCVALGV